MALSNKWFSNTMPCIASNAFNTSPGIKNGLFDKALQFPPPVPPFSPHGRPPAAVVRPFLPLVARFPIVRCRRPSGVSPLARVVGKFALAWGSFPPRVGKIPSRGGSVPLRRGSVPLRRGKIPVKGGVYPPREGTRAARVSIFPTSGAKGRSPHRYNRTGGGKGRMTNVELEARIEELGVRMSAPNL